MKTKNAVVIYALITLVQLFLLVNYAMGEEYYLIGTASSINEMEIFSLNGDVFKLHKKIKLPEIIYFQWPNYNRVTHDLYFEGSSEIPTHSRYIYKYNPDNNHPIEQILEGAYPALSPDGKWLAYRQGHLWLFNLEKKQTKEIADDMNNVQPPVWISNSRMLYYSINNQLILLDILTGEKRMTGYEKIIPGALSPDGKKVLCVNLESDKIILYSINDNKIETIKESKFLSINSNFIWQPNGKSFLFCRQRWSTVLQLKEWGSLFLFSLEDRTEKDLNLGIGFLGGVEGDFEKWK